MSRDAAQFNPGAHGIAAPDAFEQDLLPTRSASHHLTLVALAFGTFCIGTTEFASMGIIQLFSASLGVDLPTATHAISAYAAGVVLGGPALTLFAARLNRRTLLLLLIGIFIIGNVLSAVADGLGMFIVARFITGLPQGAYFGAGAVVASYVVGPGHGGRAFAIVMTGLTVATILGSPIATFLGQTIGWRATYLCVGGLGVLSLVSLWLLVPRSSALDGAPVAHELIGLRNGRVWLMMVVTSLGISSIFAVYTFIGPFVTDLAELPQQVTPLALAVFGVGMCLGNLYGGRLADIYPNRGITAGFGATLVVLVALGIWGAHTWVLFPALFGVGAAMMAAIPTIQVRLVALAPQSPTLMGAMNLAALNVANALGAMAGGLTIGAGLGLLSTAWAGFGLTACGLLLFLGSTRPLRGGAYNRPGMPRP
jgi:MFS transporter, DHA1 family, inner membrane transport protein